MRTWMLPTVAALLGVALVASSAVAISQHQRATDAETRVTALSDEVGDLRGELADLRDELEAARAEEPTPDVSPDPDEASEPEPPLDLFGDDLDGLLDGLLGGGSIPGQQCLVPDTGSGLDGLLDGLFGGSGLPDEPDALVEVVADQVAELRQLQWQEPVAADFLDTSQLQARLEAILDEDLDAAELDANERLLRSLGAIPADSDLEQLQRDLLDDQVAGFYVPDTGELVVRVPDDGSLRTVDQVTLAHELEHALADQTLGIPDRSEPPFADDADATFAVLAVVEGDATLVMNLWALSNLPLTEQLAMAMDPSIAAAQRAMDDIPHFLQQELLSPYMDGLDWVCDVYLDGGWAAVDAAYEDPPTTSAEVLWGERMTPAATAELDPPGGFDELSTTTLGAAHLMWLLEAPGGDPARSLDAPEARAQAWAGGSVRVWGRGEDTAVGLALVDGGTGSVPLCSTIEDWYVAAFPNTDTSTDGAVTRFEGGSPAALRCDGDDVVLGIAPDVPTATTIVGG